MDCRKCPATGQTEGRFCKECGAPLLAMCPQCGSLNELASTSCVACGRSFDLPGSMGSLHDTSGGERRQLTVLFCDLVRSTSLAEQLDPEDFRDVVREYQRLCSDAVARYEGHIAQYLGDGVLIYFGYPIAHENDVQRAVRVALAILTDLTQLDRRLKREYGVELSVRMGLHTGQAVIGEMGGGTWREQLAVGETPNVAAKVQSVAEPNTILITEATHRLVAPHFVCQSLGTHSLEGLGRPIQLYRVVSESEVETRMQAMGGAGFSALIGREPEARLLSECWQRLQTETTQVVVLTGEPGIGKSRLVEELKAHLSPQPATVLECYCQAFQRNTAFAPISHLLRRALGLRPDDSPQDKLSKLRLTLERGGPNPDDAVPLLAPLVSIPPEAGYQPPAVDPLVQRQLTLETLAAWLMMTTNQGPVLFVFEDLHWADPSSLEWLGIVLGQPRTYRLMIVLTYRTDFRPPWPLSDDVVPVPLQRLTHEQAAALAVHVAHNRTLPEEVMRVIVTRTDGIPLFVEEMTKMLLESGLLVPVDGSYTLAGPLPTQAIPTTIQDSLMARLDRLGSAKALAQVGATIGRDFRHDVLQAVVEGEEAQLERDLNRLIEAELIHRDGSPPQATYHFNHALIQDAAYATMLRERRQNIHERVASVLETQFPDQAGAVPELLAHHLTAAGIAHRAIPYWQQAGQRAAARAAHAEADRYYSAGLDLLPRMSDDAARHAFELGLRVHHGLSLSATRGYAAPQVEAAYRRARDLCDILGNTAALYPVLRGLCTFYIVRDDLGKAKELATQCLRLGEETKEAAYLISGHTALGYTHTYLGDLESGRDHLAGAVRIYRSRDGEGLRYPEAQDPAMACLCLLSHVDWMLGNAREAEETIEGALRHAEHLQRPFDLAYAHCFAAMFDNLRGEPGNAIQHATLTIDISKRHGFAVWEGAGTLQLGVATALAGDADQAIGLLTAVLPLWQARGADLNRPYFLAGLAQAYRGTGQTNAALVTIQEAIDHATRHREHWFDAELYRLRGELMALQGGAAAEAAVADLARAVDIAKRQQAKLLELRAALGFHAHCLAMGQPGRSRTALASVCEAFDRNGLASSELEEAKAHLARSIATT